MTQQEFPGNWRRWGPDDERGAANFAGPEVVQQAASLVRTGRVISLAIGDARAPPRSRRGGPRPCTRCSSTEATTRRASELPAASVRRRLPRAPATAPRTSMRSRTRRYDDALYNGHAASRVRSYGATRCGIERLQHLVTRGVLLDVAATRGVEHLEPGHAISAQRPRLARSSAQGIAVREGDCVLIRTGWWPVYRADREAYFGPTPGIADAAGRHLAAMGIAAVGADTIALRGRSGAPATSRADPRPGCSSRADPRLRVYLLELLDARGAESRPARSEFLFVAAPLRIAGRDGEPASTRWRSLMPKVLFRDERPGCALHVQSPRPAQRRTIPTSRCR